MLPAYVETHTRSGTRWKDSGTALASLAANAPELVDQVLAIPPTVTISTEWRDVLWIKDNVLALSLSNSTTLQKSTDGVNWSTVTLTGKPAAFDRVTNAAILDALTWIIYGFQLAADANGFIGVTFDGGATWDWADGNGSVPLWRRTDGSGQNRHAMDTFGDACVWGQYDGISTAGFIPGVWYSGDRFAHIDRIYSNGYASDPQNADYNKAHIHNCAIDPTDPDYIWVLQSSDGNAVAQNKWTLLHKPAEWGPGDGEWDVIRTVNISAEMVSKCDPFGRIWADCLGVHRTLADEYSLAATVEVPAGTGWKFKYNLVDAGDVTCYIDGLWWRICAGSTTTKRAGFYVSRDRHRWTCIHRSAASAWALPHYIGRFGNSLIFSAEVGVGVEWKQITVTNWACSIVQVVNAQPAVAQYWHSTMYNAIAVGYPYWFTGGGCCGTPVVVASSGYSGGNAVKVPIIYNAGTSGTLRCNTPAFAIPTGQVLYVTWKGWMKFVNVPAANARAAFAYGRSVSNAELTMPDDQIAVDNYSQAWMPFIFQGKTTAAYAATGELRLTIYSTTVADTNGEWWISDMTLTASTMGWLSDFGFAGAGQSVEAVSFPVSGVGAAHSGYFFWRPGQGSIEFADGFGYIPIATITDGTHWLQIDFDCTNDVFHVLDEATTTVSTAAAAFHGADQIIVAWHTDGTQMYVNFWTPVDGWIAELTVADLGKNILAPTSIIMGQLGAGTGNPIGSFSRPAVMDGNFAVADLKRAVLSNDLPIVTTVPRDRSLRRDRRAWAGGIARG